MGSIAEFTGYCSHAALTRKKEIKALNPTRHCREKPGCEPVRHGVMQVSAEDLAGWAGGFALQESQALSPLNPKP